MRVEGKIVVQKHRCRTSVAMVLSASTLLNGMHVVYVVVKATHARVQCSHGVRANSTACASHVVVKNVRLLGLFALLFALL